METRAQIVSNYTPMVRNICRRYQSPNESPDDLLQIGMIGLLNAIEKFDPNYGASFTSVAIPEIRGILLNHFRDHGTLVKIPRSMRRNRLMNDKVATSLAVSLGHWPNDEELAQICDLSEDEVHKAKALSQGWNPRSLDEVVESGDGESRLPLSELLGSEDEGFDAVLDRLFLATALDTLADREKKILRFRILESMSRRQVAELVGISQMHVSRLERSALKQLKQAFQMRYADRQTAEPEPDHSAPEVVTH